MRDTGQVKEIAAEQDALNTGMDDSVAENVDDETKVTSTSSSEPAEAKTYSVERDPARVGAVEQVSMAPPENRSGPAAEQVSKASTPAENCERMPPKSMEHPKYAPTAQVKALGKVVDREFRLKLQNESARRFGVALPPSAGATVPESWLVTPHGFTLAEALFSCSEISSLCEGKRVVELGSGMANQSVILKKQKPSWLTCTESTDPRARDTRLSMEFNRCGSERNSIIEYIVTEWTNVRHDCLSVDSSDGRRHHNSPKMYDVIVANPLFCKSGKRNRRYFIDSLILESHKLLDQGGYLVFCQSSMANLNTTMNLLKVNGFAADVVYSSVYPWRDYYYEDESFLDECEAFEEAYIVDDEGTRYETIYIIKAKLLEWTPHDFVPSVPCRG